MNAPPLPTSSAFRQSPPVTGWKRPARRVLAAALGGFVLLLACSRQGEGDRCSPDNDHNDCESGLLCTDWRDLRDGEADRVPRCCRPDGEGVGDGRCTRLIGGGTTTTTGGGGQAGESGTSTTAGQSCTYNSQCPEGMICGPKGMCQLECLDDRDCGESLVCRSNRCVSG